MFLKTYTGALVSMMVLLRSMNESYGEERMRYQKARELASTAQRDLLFANLRQNQSALRKEALAVEALNTLSKRYVVYSPLCLIRDADLSVNMLPSDHAEYLMWDEYIAQREYLMSIYLYEYKSSLAGVYWSARDHHRSTDHQKGTP